MRAETIEILRDPIRLAFSFLGPLILMLTVGYGISFDVEQLAYAAFDQDQTNESRELLENFSGSRYFGEHNDIASDAESEQRLKSGQLKIAPEIPTNFGKELLTDKVWLDGAVPFRAETASGYVEGLALSFLTDQAATCHIAGLRPLPVNVEARFKYNRAFKSVYQTIPSTIMLVLILIPAMMTAVGVAREKETGSIANFRSTPIPGIEFLLGK
jgi:ribosome-dependent ATPase